MQHIEEIEARIARFDARLLDGLQDEQNVLALLQTLPGVDLIGAAMLLVEIGPDMDAFGSADRQASWVGICPGNNESAGKRKSGRVRKGNLYVRRLLCESRPNPLAVGETVLAAAAEGIDYYALGNIPSRRATRLTMTLTKADLIQGRVDRLRHAGDDDRLR